jgi:methyl-accepting chemotaxis protein
MGLLSNYKVSNKLIIILLPVFAILAAMIFFQFKSFSDKDLNNQKMFAADKNSKQVRRLIDDFEARGLEIATIFANNSDVIRAYNFENEKEGAAYLKNAIGGMLDKIKSQNNIDQIKLHFHKVPGKSFLRVWSDKRFDDLRGFRNTILEVYRTKKPVKAIELGRGGFAIRGIAPIFDGDKLIGSVEMFYSPLDIAKFIADGSEKLGLFFLVNKEKAEELFLKEEIEAKYKIEVGGHLASDQSAEWIDPVAMTTPENIIKAKETGEIINEDKGNFAVSYIPIKDFEGNVIGQTVFIKDFTQKIESTFSTIIMINTIIGVIIILIIIILIVGMKSFVSKPLNGMTLALESMSKGNINFKNNSNEQISGFLQNTNKDEIGELSRSFDTTVKIINNLVEEVQTLTNSASQGDLSYRGDCDKFSGSFNDIVCGINTTVENIVVPFNTAKDYMQKISSGVIPERITEEYYGDFDTIKVAINDTIFAVQSILDDTEKLSEAAQNGHLDYRADFNKFRGRWKDMVQGFNGVIDSIVMPLNVAAEYVDRISKGDIPPKITDEYKGDFNEIKNNLNQAIDSVNLLVTDAKMLSNAADEGKLDTRAEANRHNGEFRTIIDGVNRTLDNVIGPLNVAAEYIDRISKGDIPPKITENYNGDFNEIKNNLNQAIESVNLLVTDAKMLATAADEGKLDTRADASKHNGDFRAVVEGVNRTLDNVILPLNVAAEYIDRISKGDIPPKITDNYNGDFNEIKNNLNLCIDSLNAMLNDVDLIIDNIMHAKLRYRADSSKHNGDFSKLMKGINSTLDRVIDILDNIAAPIMGIDKEFNIVFMNTMGAALDKRDVKDIENDKCYNHFKTSHCETKQCACHRAQAENKTVSAETDAHPGGLDLEIKYTGFPIKDEEGNILGAFEIVMDQTEIKNTLKEIQEISEYQANETDKIVQNISKAAQGDFSTEFDLSAPNETTKEAYETLSHIIDSVETFINSVKGLQRDISELTDSAIEGNLSDRADASIHNGEFKRIIEGLNNILDEILQPINEAGQVLEVMATGDLRVRMQGNYKGDNATLKQNVNMLGDSLSQLIMQVNESVYNSASSASEISATSDSLAASTQEQSAQADEVASAVEEMSRTVTDNAMSASRTSEVANSNGEIAKEGAGVVEQTVSKMRDIANVVQNSAGSIQKLGDSSKKIGEIISVIDDIADQTNLLALNAAIEAARAGEQGRGFAVVADEVRKLAERTTEATKQIANMIKGIQKETESAVIAMNEGTSEVNSGIELADQAGLSLNKILNSTEELIDMINQIAAASEEQSATSEQISKNVVSISKVTAESAQRVEDVSKTANELARATEDLSMLMQKFKVDETLQILEEKEDLRISNSNDNSRHLPDFDA